LLRLLRMSAALGARSVARLVALARGCPAEVFVGHLDAG